MLLADEFGTAGKFSPNDDVTILIIPIVGLIFFSLASASAMLVAAAFARCIPRM